MSRLALMAVGNGRGAERPAGRRHSARVDLAIVLAGTFYYTQSSVIANLMLGGRLAPSAESSGAVIGTATGAMVESTRIVVLVLMLGVVIVRNLGNTRGSPAPLAVLLAYTVALQLTTFIATTSLDTSTRWWVLPLLGVAVWFVAPRVDDLVVLGWATLAVAVFSIGLALVDPGRAFMMLNEFLEETNKAIIGSQQLAGPFAQMNILGMSMAVGFPFVFLIRNRVMRFAGAAVVFYTLLWSASRTSVLALSITIGSSVVIFAFRSTVVRRRLFGLATIAMAGVVVVLPLVTTDPGAFTNRGDIWIASISQWLDNPVFGYGSMAYAPGTTIAKAIGYASWHGHNAFVSAFTMGGIVLALMFVVLVAAVSNAASRVARQSLAPEMFVLLIVSLGMTEVPLRMDDYDGVGWIAWPALVMTLCATLRPAPVGDAPLVAPSAGLVVPPPVDHGRPGRHRAAV